MCGTAGVTQKEPRAVRSPAMAADAAAGVLLIVLGAWWALFAVEHARVKPDVYYLSAAVGVATGRGFVAPRPAPGSALDRFLSSGSTTLAWADATAPAWEKPDQYIQANRFLIHTIGLVWRVTGISWDAVGQVAAALHVLLVIGAYMLARLFLPLPFALGGALWIAASSLNLRLLPHLRDYSKGAFIIAILPLVVVLALRARSRVAVTGVSAAVGVLTGFGLGFKMDVAIMLPLAVVSIVGFRGRRPWTGLGEKALALAALGAGFAIAAGSMLASMSSGGSNAAHVILLGWARVFDVDLGIPRTLYSVLPFYSDSYVAMVTQAFHQPDAAVPLRFTSAEYDQAGLSLWFHLARTFPADIVVRVIAAVNQTLNLAFLYGDYSYLDRPLPGASAMTVVSGWLHQWKGWGAGLGLSFIAAVLTSNIRTGVLAAWLTVALGGYSFLQFGDRHYFHAQVIPVFMLASMSRVTISAGARLARRGNPLAGVPLCPVLVVAAVMLLILVAPLTVLRAWQSRALAGELERFERHGLTRMPIEVSPDGRGNWRVRWPTPALLEGQVPAAMPTAYYLAEFTVDDPAGLILAGADYDATMADRDFSRVLTLTPARGINLIGFAVTSVPGQSVFAGLEIGDEARRRLSALYLVPTGPASLPIDIGLPADWRAYPLYQRLQEEPGAGLPGPAVVCAGDASCGSVLSSLETVERGDFRAGEHLVAALLSPIATVSTEGIVIDGHADGASSYLAQLKDWTTTGAGVFVVRGRLRQGGVAIGLLKDERWYKQVIVNEPGDFLVAVPVDQPGTYQPLLTNALRPGQRLNQVVIRKVALLPAAVAP